MSKKKDARQVLIRQIINEEGKIKVVDLAKRLNITPETLRTDLNEMEQQSLIVREHGYARINNSLNEIPVFMRELENPEIKKRIIFRAMKEVKDGQVIYIDSGSTVLCGLNALTSKKGLTIVTNSIPVAQQCSTMNHNIFFIGGMVIKEGLRTYGHFATDMIDHVQIDVAIMGTDGIADADGFTTNSAHEVGSKRHIMNQSKKVITVMDHSKFSSRAPFKYCSFKEQDMIITNGPLSSDELEQIKDIKEIIQI